MKYANVGFPNHPYMNHMNSVNNNYTHTNRRNSDNDPRPGTRAGRTVSGGCSYDRQVDTCATEATVMTTVPEGKLTDCFPAFLDIQLVYFCPSR